MSKTGTKIHKFNIFYTLLKAYQLLVFHLFYKKVEVIGKENIPKDRPIIFTPNHQNALMDALIVLNTCGSNPVFMARADIFKKKTQKKILTFLKMLPVYRLRDGAEELSKNDDTFNICLDILSDSKPVCLMPEGNHGDKRRLRPLVKGTFRIAFKAQQEYGDKNPVVIVPVGIDFEHYQHIRQDLTVIYGKPIEVKDYMEAYNENPARAMNLIKDRLVDELKKIIIHIENDEHYDMFQSLREIYNLRIRNRIGISGNSLYNQFEADKQMISMLDEYCISEPETIKNLSADVAHYTTLLKKLNLRNWVIDRAGYSCFRNICQGLLLLVLSPLFLFGYIANVIPYTIPIRATRNVKDSQFISSFAYAVALIVFLLYYIVILTITGILTGPFWIPWAVIFIMLGSGYMALQISSLFKKLRASVRFRNLRKKKDKNLGEAVDLHGRIISTLNELTEKFIKSLITEKLKKEHEKF